MTGRMAGGSAVDVIVAGLGAHGGAAAAALARRGLSVAGFDAGAPPHSLGSSHGGTRIIREVYAEHPAYVPIVQRAYRLWRRLEEESGGGPGGLLRITGGVTIGMPGSPSIQGIRRSAQVHGSALEILDAGQVRARWPQFQPRGEWVGAFDANGGVLFVEKCVRAQLEEAARLGARLHFNEPVREWRPDGGGVKVSTAAGEYWAGALVLATGAWNRRWLSELELPLRVERQVMVWFEPADGEGLFGPGRCPNHSWEWAPGCHLYGQPDFGEGVKVGIHHGGKIYGAPEDVDREVHPSDEAALQAAVSGILPGLGAVLRSAVCLYTNTPDMHFLLDVHPGRPNVVISSACSGHGFKFSPAVGEIIAGLATGQKPPFDISMFGIQRLLQKRKAGSG